MKIDILRLRDSAVRNKLCPPVRMVAGVFPT